MPYCSSCGASNPTAAFCYNCGGKMFVGGSVEPSAPFNPGFEPLLAVPVANTINRDVEEGQLCPSVKCPSIKCPDLDCSDCDCDFSKSCEDGGCCKKPVKYIGMVLGMGFYVGLVVGPALSALHLFDMDITEGANIVNMLASVCIALYLLCFCLSCLVTEIDVARKELGLHGLLLYTINFMKAAITQACIFYWYRNSYSSSWGFLTLDTVVSFVAFLFFKKVVVDWV
jgi:hypothetical protein